MALRVRAAVQAAALSGCTSSLFIRRGDKKVLPCQRDKEGHHPSWVSLPTVPAVGMVMGSPIPLSPMSMPPISLSPVPMRRAIVSTCHKRRSHHNHGWWGSDDHGCRHPNAHGHTRMCVRRERESKQRETCKGSHCPHAEQLCGVSH